MNDGRCYHVVIGDLWLDSNFLSRMGGVLLLHDADWTAIMNCPKCGKNLDLVGKAHYCVVPAKVTVEVLTPPKLLKKCKPTPSREEVNKRKNYMKEYMRKKRAKKLEKKL